MKPIDLQGPQEPFCEHCFTVTQNCGFHCQKEVQGIYSDPCRASDWEECPYNKPAPVKEWKWAYESRTGGWFISTRWHTSVTGFLAAFDQPPTKFQRIDVTERIRGEK